MIKSPRTSFTLHICRKLTFHVYNRSRFKSNILCDSRDINRDKRYAENTNTQTDTNELLAPEKKK